MDHFQLIPTKETSNPKKFVPFHFMKFASVTLLLKDNIEHGVIMLNRKEEGTGTAHPSNRFRSGRFLAKTNMVNTGYQQDHNKVLDQMRKAFLINFLPGEL